MDKQDIKQITLYPCYWCNDCECFFDEQHVPDECPDNKGDDCKLTVHLYKEFKEEPRD